METFPHHHRIQLLLAKHELDVLLLQRTSSFAWATGGGSAYVNSASTTGAASLLITPQENFIITNNIEAPRLEAEEGLAQAGWTLQVAPWYETNRLIADLSAGLRLGSDFPFSGAKDLSTPIARLRSELSPPEVTRFRDLGLRCAAAMEAACERLEPGQSEYEIAALLAEETLRRGAQPIVNLIATDERIYRYRHPLPTAKALDRYAMLVLCGRHNGLVCSVTRLVHFGPLPHELHRKSQAVALVDAAAIVATRPGQTLAQIFQAITTAYTRAGYPDEWRLHHQGGPAGYEPREHLATAHSPWVVTAGQVYAWNPSITGTKSEDSVLVGDAGPEVLTRIEGWPEIQVEIDGETISRPAILER